VLPLKLNYCLNELCSENVNVEVINAPCIVYDLSNYKLKFTLIRLRI